MTLKIDKDLINNNFDTYHISLKSPDVKEIKINTYIHDWVNEASTSSFAKSSLVSHFNSLFIDKFFDSHVYFISNDFKVFKCQIDDVSNNLIIDGEIFQIPNNNANFDSGFPQIFFIDKLRAVIYNGHDKLFEVNTFQRDEKCIRGDLVQNWEVKRELPHDFYHNQGFTLILDCRFSLEKEDMICVYLTVCEKHNEFDKPCLLNSVYFHLSKNLCQYHKQWLGDKVPELVNISSDYSTLHLVGDDSFRYNDTKFDINKYDSKTEWNIPTWLIEDNSKFTVQCYIINCPSDLFYHIDYKQDRSDDENSLGKSLITLKCSKDSSQSFIIFNDDLPDALDIDQSMLTIVNNMAVLKIPRKNPIPISCEDDGDIPAKRLCQDDLEECDTCNEGDHVLVELTDSNSLPRKIDISSYRWLFNTPKLVGSSQAVCLRVGVDGLIFLNDCESENFEWCHVSTLNAFGYVSASKENQRFLLCSLLNHKANNHNVEYAAVVDCSRHIYIYQQHRQLIEETTLRNRRTNQRFENIAEQYLVTLPNAINIVGAQMNHSRLFVLYLDRDNGVNMTVITCP